MKVLRRKLGESTDLDKIQNEIEEYERFTRTDGGDDEPLIDAIVHTTSSKQATAQILRFYGVEMNWVWDELKKTAASLGHK